MIGVGKEARDEVGSPARVERLRSALVGRYVLGREIGRGGMAAVYLAHDVKHDRRVAIKVLHPELAVSLGSRRFQREIRLAAQLHHPHILPVYDSGKDAGVLWFTMPYVEGQTLRRRLKEQGRLPVVEAAGLLEQLARALAYAHRRGLVHRDVKPENVLLGEDSLFLADFGIAKPIERGKDPQLTSAELIVGTPAYMAPEQAPGGGTIDHRADLYALGILGYELLAGEPPFTGLSLGPLLVAHATREPEPIERRRPDVPAPLAAAIARCLRKDPAERWPSAEELSLALRAVGTAEMSERQPPGTAAGAAPTSPRYSHPLERARTAFQRAAWRDAYAAFTTVGAAELEGEDLERLGEAAWWVADTSTALCARERAYRRYLDRGEPTSAARVALALAEDNFHRLARSVAQGWLRRAERHLERFPEAPELGWLCRLQMQLALETERSPEKALTLADRSLEIARRTGDADLEALALQDRGRILVALGRLAEGMRLIEDAMTAASAGELSPRTTGRTLCNMISTCERLGDLGRAVEWHAVVHAWSERHAESGFPGVCRVYHAGILRLRGDLAGAEQAATRAARELESCLIDVAGEAFYELGEINLRKGALVGADAMFTEAHARGRNPQPGLALLRLAQGDGEAARAMIWRALAEPGLRPLDRVKLLPALVEISAASGQADLAAEGASELRAITTTYASPALCASAALALGRAALAAGRPGDALQELRRARQIWTEIDLPFELARTRELLAQAHALLGEPEEAELEDRAARAILARIRTAS